MYAGDGMVLNSNEVDGQVSLTPMSAVGEPLGIVRPPTLRALRQLVPGALRPLDRARHAPSRSGTPERQRKAAGVAGSSPACVRLFVEALAAANPALGIGRISFERHVPRRVAPEAPCEGPRP
jgi:hypothetical protein